MNKLLVPITAFLVFFIDRITKLYLPVTKYFNTGAAFGILHGQTLFLTVFAVVVLIVLVIYTIRENRNLTPIQKLGIGMIIGGTAGNLLDRVLYGYVIDFIDLPFIDFPVFNLADTFINIGAAVLLITLLARK